MIVYYGFSDKLKNLSYYDSSGRSDYSFSKPYSEDTAKLIDEEVKVLIDEQYERAKSILSENMDGLKQLASILIENEVIFAEDVERIFGKRPWISRADELSAESEQMKNNSEKDKVSEEKEEPANVDVEGCASLSEKKEQTAD